jgi:hypothetical protein
VSAHLRIEWERRIATRPEGERLVMFKNVCIDAAEYVGRNGAAKSEIIKVLTDIAVGHAFFGIDGGEIGRIIDDSLDAAEVERISWEELSKAADEKQRGLSPPLTLADWLSRKLPTPDYLLGHLLSTTSRVQINAPTGIGKTMLGIAIAMRLPAGSGFLHWDGVRRARTPRTLLIDGEMSRRLLQQRLIDEAARLGGPIPEGMHILSREDFENFAPLNKPEGQKLIEQQIERIGGVDLITFDNVMSLIEGDMKDEESWRQMLPWVLSLTRRSIGQLWLHHTGHDATRGYGTKTREWQMDTVIHLDPIERPDTDVSFLLSFRKARERTPATRAEFADAHIALVNDRWTSDLAARSTKTKVSPLARKFYDALVNATVGGDTPKQFNCPTATIEEWRNEGFRLGLLDKDKPKNASALFSKYKRDLIAANWIACNETLAWTL